MRMITAVHYVPKPGGGVASPGETLAPEIAARFTDAQITHLVLVGAIDVMNVPEPKDAVGNAAGEAQDFTETPQATAGAEPEDETEDFEPEPEPPEIDTLDGIVRADESHEKQTAKPKTSASRAGRRKAK